MKMKKLCLLSLLVLVICACGKDKMELPEPNKKIEQKDKDKDPGKTTEKKDDKKDEGKKDEGKKDEEKNKEKEEEKKGEEPKDKDAEKPKEDSEKPKEGDEKLKEGAEKKNQEDEKKEKEPAVELTLADIEAYYAFDKSKTVNPAERQIRATKVEKRVNNKTVKVTEVISINRADTEGSITYKIKGNVNGQPFEQTFTSTDFQKQPTEASVARSLKISWKNRIEGFDFETLLLKKGTQKYTADYLKQYIDFEATADDGRIYPLTAEDLALLKVKSIDLTDHALLLAFTYRNTDTPRLQLDFDKMKFLLDRVQVNTQFVKNRYMSGVFSYLATFFPDLLTYDHNLYTVELEREGLAKTKDDADNTFSFDLRLNAKGSQTPLIKFTKKISGFKPLTDLKKELKMTATKELQDYIRGMFGPDAHKQGDITKRLENTAEWIRKTSPTLTRNGVKHSLSWAQTGSAGQIALLGEINNNSLDLHFADPQFRLESISLKDQTIELKVQLTSVNGQRLNEVYFTIVVNNI